MNFQYISPVEPYKIMLDQAFRKAREKGQQKSLRGNWLQIIRQKETLKLDIIKDLLVSRLEKILQEFPHFKQLPEFYVKLVNLTMDEAELKTSLGAVNWAVGKIRFFQSEYVRKIVKCKDRRKITELSRQFYGRISSVLKQVSKNMQYLEECRKVMRTYPDIQEMFTVCLYGFPNVGKTTLLNQLTGTKAKVAAYAFTTLTINAGYTKINDCPVQFLDVPGTLARTEKMNNIELQADLVIKELADVIIYVFDLTEQCGYSVQKQEQLLKSINKEKKVLVYLSKTDLIGKEDLDLFKHRYYGIEEIKKKVSELLD